MKAFIGVGSNIGEKIENCIKAISFLNRIEGCSVIKRSSFYKTEPIGYKDQDWFVNCAVMIETELSPYELLKKLKEIELLMGREKGIKWGPRIIDLDILMYEDIVIDEDELTIPHPLMHKRRFVLVPMNEIAPDIEHPVLKKSIKELLRRLPEDGQEVFLLKK